MGVSVFCTWEEGRSFAVNRQAMLGFENTSMNSSPSSFCPHQRSSLPPPPCSGQWLIQRLTSTQNAESKLMERSATKGASISHSVM